MLNEINGKSPNREFKYAFAFNVLGSRKRQGSDAEEFIKKLNRFNDPICILEEVVSVPLSRLNFSILGELVSVFK